MAPTAYIPAPKAMPMPAVVQMPAEVVSPRMALPRTKMTPAPKKLMPATTDPATREASKLPPQAAASVKPYLDTSIIRAAPRATTVWVRMPASFSRTVRSVPTAAPHRQASTIRRRNTSCCVIEYPFSNDGPSVQHGPGQFLSPVDQLQGEKGRVPVQQVQKDPVPRPHGQLPQLFPGHPFQNALVALLHLSGKAPGGEQVHIFTGPHVGHKGDDAPVPVVGEGEAGLFQHLPADAVLGAFPLQELASHADPLVPVFVLLLFDPVEH